MRQQIEVMQVAASKKAEAGLKRPKTWSPAAWESSAPPAPFLPNPAVVRVATSAGQDASR